MYACAPLARAIVCLKQDFNALKPRSFAARCVDYALCLTCVNKAEANPSTPRTRQEEFFEPLDVVVQDRVKNGATGHSKNLSADCQRKQTLAAL